MTPSITTTRCMLALILCLLAGLGCDKVASPDTDGTASYFDDNPQPQADRPGTTTELIVTPDQATASFTGQQITFTARGGKPPYTWDSQRNWAGTVVSGADEQGIYTVVTVAENTVIVYDARNAAAVATIGKP